MSWLAKNYDKAVLGGALVCTLAFAYGGWQALNRVESDFVSNVRGRGSSDTDVASAGAVINSISSLALNRNWSRDQFDDRPVDLFVSIPLFVTQSAPTRPIDLMRDAPVHPPIPNTWWLENRIDPGFQDSPDLDGDGDGFTNMEEYLAGTDPNNAKSHPPLIAKLKYLSVESLSWALRPSHPDENGGNTFRYYDDFAPRGRTNNTGAANPVLPGGLFFASGAAEGRFKLLGHETREQFNERTNANELRTFARIEDQHPNKKGTIYEFPAPLPEANVQLHQQHDRTAVFTLEAIGRNGVEFKIEEFTTFTLPVDGEGPTHKLLSVTPEHAVVEYTDADGNVRNVTIPKGSLPQM
ncbi:MAG: Amuc_1099 family pilus-like system protein [Luteolibacter sp.]|jgi:hypothetical protein